MRRPRHWPERRAVRAARILGWVTVGGFAVTMAAAAVAVAAGWSP